MLSALRHAVDGHALTLLVAPAGSGKTTALVQYAQAVEDPHAWYQAAPTRTHPSALLEHLRLALHPVLKGMVADEPWPTVDVAARALDAVAEPRRTLLIIDDVHELLGSSAESALQEFVQVVPPWLKILAATRHLPGFDLSTLRLSERLVEIRGDVLRWRPWEVERLFRDHYRMALRPEEAARLTQRTEGWVAGLQLFHLASQHLPVARRTRLIDDLNTRPGLVRDYLAHNVLRGLPTDLQEFLVDTCVLGQLEPSICDELRERSDSRTHLATLRDRHLFLLPREDGCGYRYHEVLRAYLEATLLERDGATEMRARCHRAGRILEKRGAIAEAVHAYTRADAWDDATRLLGTEGPRMAAADGRAILASLPASLVESDPWLRLTQAREYVGAGQLARAVEAYRGATEAFGDLPGARLCRDEQTAVQPWLDPRPRPARTITDRLRQAVHRDPRSQATALECDGTANRQVAASACQLLTGAVADAQRLAHRAGSSPDAEIVTMGLAGALGQVARLAGGLPHDPGDLLWAAKTLEQLGIPWVARLARTIVTCATLDGVDEAIDVLEHVDPHADPWGRAVMALVAGIASIIHDRPRPDLLTGHAAEGFRALGAGTLEAWARAWGALARARAGEPEPVADAEAARSLARNLMVPGAEAVAELALASVGGPDANEAMARATSLATELGLALPASRPPAAPAGDETVIVLDDAPARITCFGELSLDLGRGPLDLSGLRPQCRAALAILALHTNTPVHRERLMEALWPGADPEVTSRRLQVLVSTIRRHLDDASADRSSLVVRSGETYTLQMPSGTRVDVQEFDDAVAAGLQADRRGDAAGAIRFLTLALEVYGGELLPESGPAAWVVDDRDRYRLDVAEAAQVLTQRRLETGDPTAALTSARVGLQADRYRSQLWCLLAEAHRAMGDLAAAAHAEDRHAAVLEELGVRTGCCPSMDPRVLESFGARTRQSGRRGITAASTAGSR